MGPFTEDQLAILAMVNYQQCKTCFHKPNAYGPRRYTSRRKM